AGQGPLPPGPRQRGGGLRGSGASPRHDVQLLITTACWRSACARAGAVFELACSPAMEHDMKTMTRVALLAVLASTLSGCFLTKIVTTPMRVGGAAVSTVGAVLSIVPVAGNTADAALEKA